MAPLVWLCKGDASRFRIQSLLPDVVAWVVKVPKGRVAASVGVVGPVRRHHVGRVPLVAMEARVAMALVVDLEAEGLVAPRSRSSGLHHAGGSLARRLCSWPPMARLWPMKRALPCPSPAHVHGRVVAWAAKG